MVPVVVPAGIFTVAESDRAVVVIASTTASGTEGM